MGTDIQPSQDCRGHEELSRAGQEDKPWESGCRTSEDPEALEVGKGRAWGKERESREAEGETPVQGFSGKEELGWIDSRTQRQGQLMVCAHGYHLQNPVNETW